MSDTEKQRKDNTDEKPVQSIFVIECKLEQLRKAGLKTKADRTERDRLKSLLNRLYADSKNKVMQFEQNN